MPTKVRLVKGMVFPVVMYGCESWNKESWVPKHWCFWTVVLEKTLESLLCSMKIQPVHPKGNQFWIFIGRTLMLKLKLQYFGHLMWRTDSFEKMLMLGKIEGEGEGNDKGWDGWMTSPTRWTWVWVSSRSWWWTGKPGMLQSMGLQRIGHDWVTELNWTTVHQAPLSMEVSRKACSSGFPVPYSGDLANPGIEPRSPVLQADSLPAEPECCMPFQFSCSVVSDSLWSHGLQHTRLPCPSPTPRAYSNSCPSSWWCHPTISSSVVPFSGLQSFPASGSFPRT